MGSMVCSTCCHNKTVLKCESCEQITCKYCLTFIDDDRFEFLTAFNEDLCDKAFCPRCYDQNIAKEISTYEQTLERAKNVDVYGSDQSTETRLMSRLEEPVVIEECSDRKRALMWLAFKASLRGFDTIVDTEIRPKKVGRGTYRKQIWSGIATPVDLREFKKKSARPERTN